MNFFNIFLFINFFNIMFFLIDKMVSVPIIFSVKKDIVNNKKDYGRTRWYILHIFINILCFITSFSGIYLTIKNIHTSLNPIKFAEPYTIEWFIGPTSPIPSLIVASGHIYHLIFFTTSKSDIYHHLFFALTMTTINMIGDFGLCRNSVSFILCGLPGIIEYTIMSLYKLGFMRKKIMRYLVTLMHCLLRLPLGIIISYSILYQVFFNVKVYNPIMSFMIGILVIINVVQYCFENIKSSIKHYKIK